MAQLGFNKIAVRQTSIYPEEEYMKKLKMKWKEENINIDQIIMLSH